MLLSSGNSRRTKRLKPHDENYLSFALVPVLLWPQTPPAETPTPETVTKIIRVHNARPEKLVELLRPGTPAILSANDALKAIVIRGKPSDVAALERTIRELDSASTTAASRNVELMVYLLSGSNAQPASSTAADKLPALAPVVKQLRAIFPYSDYQLLSTMLLRSGEGTKTTTNGLLKSFQNAAGQNGVGGNYQRVIPSSTIRQPYRRTRRAPASIWNDFASTLTS